MEDNLNKILLERNLKIINKIEIKESPNNIIFLKNFLKKKIKEGVI